MNTMEQPNNFSITQTVQRFGKRLLSFIRGKVKSNEDAEDILQEVWYQLSKLSNLDELESVSGWLYQIARNKVTDSYRKKSSDSIEAYRYENEDGEVNFKELLLLDEASNPDLALFKEMFWEELMKALNELPEKQREVFILNEIEDLTLQEIADRTGENLKTIISRKGYATKHLRNRLTNLYQDLTQ